MKLVKKTNNCNVLTSDISEILSYAKMYSTTTTVHEVLSNFSNVAIFF